MARPISLAIVAVLTIASCAGTSPAATPGTTTAPPADSPVATAPLTTVPTPTPTHSPIRPDPTALPISITPVCDDGEQPYATNTEPMPGDGVPDPEGRFVFGRITRWDEVKGQIVSLYAVDPDGSDMSGLLNCDVARPRISPDGKRVAFGLVMSDQSFQVATMAIDGTDLRVLTNTPGYAETPDWSPDGSWLIYSHAPEACVDFVACVNDGNIWNLWRINADGTDARLIGNPDTFDWEPQLSPDGSEAVFLRQDLTDPNLDRVSIWIRNLITGQERPLADGDRQLQHADWSHDGMSIIYNTACAPCEQIELMPADNPAANPSVLYVGSQTRAGFKPVFSPDGSSIGFGCLPGVCRMDADGSNPTTIVPNRGNQQFNHLDWGTLPTD